MVVRELAFERRGQPTDRLKSEEEIAREEKERLEKLEVWELTTEARPEIDTQNCSLFLSLLMRILLFLLNAILLLFWLLCMYVPMFRLAGYKGWRDWQLLRAWTTSLLTTYQRSKCFIIKLWELIYFWLCCLYRSSIKKDERTLLYYKDGKMVLPEEGQLEDDKK